MERIPITRIMSTKIQSALLVTMLTSFLFGGRECRTTVLLEPHSTDPSWSCELFFRSPEASYNFDSPGGMAGGPLARSCCSILNFLDCPSTPATPSGDAQHLAGFAVVWGHFKMVDPPPAKTCQGCATALRARFAKISLNVWQIVQSWSPGTSTQLSSTSVGPSSVGRKTGRSMSWKLLGHGLATTAIAQHHQTSG